MRLRFVFIKYISTSRLCQALAFLGVDKSNLTLLFCPKKVSEE